jgi:outer membrane protein assembly factor BamC
MKINMPLTKITCAILLTLSVTSCARFEKRAQAEDTFNYETSTLIDNYKTGDFTRDEQRDTHIIPDLSKQQNEFGLMGKDVDIRPPTQLMAVIEGVQLDPDAIHTKIWFNAFDNDQQMDKKIWDLIIQYLSSKNATQMNVDLNTFTIDTGPIIRKAIYSSNEVNEEARYILEVAKATDGRSASLVVDVKSFKQMNNEFEVKQVLAARTKHSIEIDFINDLLQYAYIQKESEKIETTDEKPLPIKLGFDDNHQTAWIIDTNFTNVWNKLPQLLQTMSFEAVQNDKSLGYFLVKFVPQKEAYWAKNNLNPITLSSGEYFAQLGELDNGQTSLVWLDADKKILPDQDVTNLYLSITDKLRTVILNNDIQTKPL